MAIGAAGWRGPLVVDAFATLAGVLAAAVAVDHTGSAVPLVASVLWWCTVVRIVRSDLEAFIIPDWCSVAVAVLGLAQAVGGPAAEGGGAGEALRSGAAALAMGASGFALFWVLGAAARRVAGREALGFGDVKLAGACAVWLAPGEAALAVEVAALAAIAVLLLRRGRGGPVRDVAVPFGAFLAPAAWGAFVFGPLLGAAGFDLR